MISILFFFKICSKVMDLLNLYSPIVTIFFSKIYFQLKLLLAYVPCTVQKILVSF